MTFAYPTNKAWHDFLETSGLLIPGVPPRAFGLAVPMRVEIAVECAPYDFGWPEIAHELGMTITRAGSLVEEGQTGIHKLARAVHAILKKKDLLNEDEIAKPPEDPVLAIKRQRIARVTSLRQFVPSMKGKEFKFGNLGELLSVDIGQTRQRGKGARQEGTYEKKTSAIPAAPEEPLDPKQQADKEWQAAKAVARSLNAEERVEREKEQWAAAQARARELSTEDNETKHTARNLAWAARRAKKDADKTTNGEISEPTAKPPKSPAQKPAKLTPAKTINLAQGPFAQLIQARIDSTKEQTSQSLSQRLHGKFTSGQIQDWADGKSAPTSDESAAFVNTLNLSLTSRLALFRAAGEQQSLIEKAAGPEKGTGKNTR